MESDSLLFRETAQDPHRDVKVVTGVRESPQRLVEAAEEVIPVHEHYAVCTDRLDRVLPVLADVGLVLQSELSDAEVDDVSSTSRQTAPRGSRRALHQRRAAADVLHEEGPRLAASVSRGLGGRDQRVV